MCENCDIGKQPSSDGMSCNSCDMGQFSSSGMECIPCEFGKSSGVGATICEDCDTGKKYDSALTRCVCADGTYETEYAFSNTSAAVYLHVGFMTDIDQFDDEMIEISNESKQICQECPQETNCDDGLLALKPGVGWAAILEFEVNRISIIGVACPRSNGQNCDSNWSTSISYDEYDNDMYPCIYNTNQQCMELYECSSGSFSHGTLCAFCIEGYGGKTASSDCIACSQRDRDAIVSVLACCVLVVLVFMSIVIVSKWLEKQYAEDQIQDIKKSLWHLRKKVFVDFRML